MATTRTTTKKATGTTAKLPETKKSPEVMERERAFAALQKAVDSCISAKNAKEPNADEIAKKEQECQELCDKYNTVLRNQAYKRYSEKDDPVKSMIEDRYISVVRLNLKRKDKTTQRFIGEIVSVNEKLSLKLFESDYGNRKFADKSWWAKAQKYAYLVAGAINQALSENAEFKYAVDSAAEEFKFNTDADPYSKNSRLKALQQTFDAIHADVKADGHDVEYILMSMSKNGGTGKIAVVNSFKATEYIMDAMHVKMTGKTYEMTSAR